MKRREFIKLLSVTAAWPLAAHAQQPQRVPKIGILNLAPTSSEQGLKRGLRDLGYVEGRNIIFEARYAEGQQDRLGGLATELLGLKPDVVASATTQAIHAIRHVSATIPIVMTATSDPIGSSLIDSLSRPGHTTGVTLLSSDVAGKHVELLKEITPDLSHVVVLAYKNHPPTALMFKESETAARALKIKLQLLEVDTKDIETAFQAIHKTSAQALIVQQSVAFVSHIPRIAALAAEHRLPSIHEIRAYVNAGGLMSYGTNVENLGYRAASFVDKILKGAHPGDLPVEQPTRFELVINLKAAKALGLTVPPTLLARADEVIE